MTQNFLSYNVQAIKASPTIAITSKVANLRAQGVPVIGLAAGEPDFDTHNIIKNAANQALKDGKTKYTQVDGIPELKDAIIAKFARDNDLNFSREEIIVSTGAKQIIYNAFQATLNKDDEVIIPTPFWVSYSDIVTLHSGKPVFMDCTNSQYKITPEKLENAITPKTKWLILNSPSNPTGIGYTKEDILGIVKILEKYPNIHVMSDDIYEHIIYDDFKFYTIAQLAPHLENRILTINGLSKSHAMTGWRIGFAGSKNLPLMKALSKIQSQSTSNPCSISQYASVAALNDISKDYFEANNQIFQDRRNFILSTLGSVNSFSIEKPNGAFYVFIDIQKLCNNNSQNISSCSDFTEYMVDNYQIAFVPGIAFGTEGYIRISYATSMDNIEIACERIITAVNTITK